MAKKALPHIFFGYNYVATYFIAWALTIFYIDGKGNKLELRSRKNYLTNHIKSKSHH